MQIVELAQIKGTKKPPAGGFLWLSEEITLVGASLGIGSRHG